MVQDERAIARLEGFGRALLDRPATPLLAATSEAK
jgi:hypothetical protein